MIGFGCSLNQATDYKGARGQRGLHREASTASAVAFNVGRDAAGKRLVEDGLAF
jgi:hypothetical protein